MPITVDIALTLCIMGTIAGRSCTRCAKGKRRGEEKMTYLTTRDGSATVTEAAADTLTDDLADFVRAYRAGEACSIAADGLLDALEDGDLLGRIAGELGVADSELQTIAEDLHDALRSAETAAELPSVLTAEIGDDSIRVRDSHGGVWHASDEAAVEIRAAADPEARAVEIAREAPMRGTWRD